MIVFILLLIATIVLGVEAFLSRSLLALGLAIGFAAFAIGAIPA